MASAGRPSKYSDKIADEICERMVNGEEIVKICLDEDMPSRTTVYRWMAERPDFGARIARAREGLADYVAWQIAELSQNCTNETANPDRVKLAALQWRAARLAPKRYSEKHITEVSGPDGGPIPMQSQVVDARALTEEQRAVLRDALLTAKNEGNEK